MPRKKKHADAPQSQAATNGREGGGVNKMDLVRKALGKLGDNAAPKEIQDYLKKAFGVEMNTKFISTYKGSILKKAAGKSRLTRSPEPAAAPPAKKEAASGGVSIEDVRAVKELADRLGPAKVRALMDVLYQ
jgi:hypothetical protein